MAVQQAPVRWPGWWFDAQIAAEHAQHLSARLGSSANATLIAGDWLAQNPPYEPKVHYYHPRRHRHRHHGRPGPPGAPQPPAQQQQQRKRPAPRQYLNGAGVTGAIGAILAALLAELHAAAFAMGWAAAVTVLGIAGLEGMEQALADLMRAAKGRLPGIIQTRISRIERALLAAIKNGETVDQLAAQITSILGSDTAAMLIASTETSWASQAAALAAYQAAGVKYLRWQTVNDGRVCARCKANQAVGPIPIGTKFPSGDRVPPAHPRCRCAALPAPPPKLRTPPAERPGGPPSV